MHVGTVSTSFMKFGDRIRIEMNDTSGRSIFGAIDQVVEKYEPDGFNIGINIDSAAGQSVLHLHIHLIPRYQGDMPDPKGGVRGVIPERQKY